jgi:hypothetical protein
MAGTPPETLEELIAQGWRSVEERLTMAASEMALVTHWFVTPQDSDVNVNAHFGSDARTARFLGVVVPTLAEELNASLVSVSVPWALDGPAPLLALISLLPNQPAVAQARPLLRNPDAATAPWWTLGEQRVAPPAELVQIAARLRI